MADNGRAPRLTRYRVLLRLDNLHDVGLLLGPALFGWWLGGGSSAATLVLLLAALFGLRCAGWLAANTLALLAYARPDAGPLARAAAVPLSGWAMLLLLLTPAALLGLLDPRLWAIPAGAGLVAALHLALRSRTSLSAFALAAGLGGVPLTAFVAAGGSGARAAGLATAVVVVWAALLLLHYGLVAEPSLRGRGVASLGRAFGGSEKPIGAVFAALTLLGLVLLGRALTASVGFWLAGQGIAAVFLWQLWYPWDHDHVRTVYRSHLIISALLAAAAGLL